MNTRINNLRKSRGEQAGFTLIELLIVIVILGILAAVVVLSVSGISNRGHDNACKAEKQSLQTAQEAYFAKSNAYAADVKALRGAGLLSGDATDNTTQYWTTTGTATAASYSKVDATCP